MSPVRRRVNQDHRQGRPHLERVLWEPRSVRSLMSRRTRRPCIELAAPPGVACLPTGLAQRAVKFVDLPAQYAALRPALERAIAGVLDTGQFVGGPELEEFERWFADYCGVRHAVGVS